MALINDIYIFVEDEQVSREIDSTTHAVEEGIDLTDNTKRKAITCSLSGKLVDYGEVKASEVLAQLFQLQLTGSIITYTGRNILKNMQIKKLDTTHPNTVAGGCEFDIDLEEVRIAQNSYTAETTTDTKDETSSGTQQVQNGTGNAVYYTVQSGDYVYKIVSNYKELHKDKTTEEACQWIMENNKDAFSTYGDFRTLKSGARLLVGYKDEVTATVVTGVVAAVETAANAIS
jgi:LysM repeat protein